MPFARPTLRALVDRFRGDIRSLTEGGDALLRRSVETVLATIVPGLTHGLHGHLAWIADQIFPDRSEDAQVLRWAAMLGLTLKPAVAAIGEAEFATTGPTIPVGDLVQRADGVQYEVTEAAVGGGAVTVQLRALVPGADGNAATATPVSLVAAIAGVTTAGTVTDADGLHDGVNVESIEQLRARVLQRLGQTPRGGGPGDYVRWALEVPGVTRAWETALVDGPGTVGLQFATDDEPGGPIPSGSKVTEVEAYVQALAPPTADVIVTAPAELELDPEITILPDTAEVRAAVEAELVDFLRREAEPGTRIPLSRISEAISGAEGEFEHVLVSPAADVEPAAGELVTLGTITWS